ncbi:MAG TPA: type II toxin-antitoxin system VapC family toxin [Thermoanaerobaculia bacterium]|nr:type II toxin-antitoxin system VapC family toxin [Thermoanaerobaculia bacterium]
MILPDLNLILHAHNRGAVSHLPAKTWWEATLSSQRPVGLCWAVMLGFIRLSTHRSVFKEPLPVAAACSEVRAWLAQPQVTILEPGRRHAPILFDLLESLGTAGNLTTDAHLAALAIEHQCDLCSTDSDFGRFPGLRWTNPLNPL